MLVAYKFEPAIVNQGINNNANSLQCVQEGVPTASGRDEDGRTGARMRCRLREYEREILFLSTICFFWECILLT